MGGPDFLTVDAFDRPPGGRIRWSRDVARAIDNGIEGLRGATVNYANNGPGRFSMDSEIVRVRIDSESERETWHGWKPSAEGTEPLVKEEPMVAIVHGILRRGRLVEFVRNNVHAASRAAHHPGHRGSIDISSQLPYEHTSISLWKTYDLAQDFAYKKGGHASAMKHSVKEKTHRVGVFLQARPLACTGTLGIGRTPFPQLPEARRAGL
jgi:hypothetical protein